MAEADRVVDKWALRFMELAETVATWSKDPSTKVGACLVDNQTRTILGLGYNGFPRGVQDTEARYADRPTKYALIVHSEVNAIMNAQGRNLAGSVLYTTKFPCTNCAKLIIQAGIAAVVSLPMDPTSPSDQRWLEEARISMGMFHEAKVAAYWMRPDGGSWPVPLLITP